MNSIKIISTHYTVYIFIGSLAGLFVIQPVNDMVIFHLYEFSNTSLSSWGFIFEQLIKSLNGDTPKKTIYYMVVGGFIGLLIAFMAGFIRSKFDVIERLNDELGKNLELLISQGESSELEFKTSFRWDVVEKRANKALEGVVLKTIAGFMNSDGGSLLIGVSDDGMVIGLENDYRLLKRPDSDGFEQAIITIVSTNLGTDLCQQIYILFHLINEKEVCRIIVKPSPRPVYLKQKGSPQFYLRTGGGTRNLNIQEATEFIKRRWE